MDSKFITLALVPLMVWAGIVGYLWMIDRKLSSMEAGEERDEL